MRILVNIGMCFHGLLVSEETMADHRRWLSRTVVHVLPLFNALAQPPWLELNLDLNEDQVCTGHGDGE